MKKVVCLLIVLLLAMGYVFAQDNLWGATKNFINKIDGNAGAMYEPKSDQIRLLTTAPVIKGKGALDFFTIEAGTSDSQSITGTVSCELLSLKDDLDVAIPVLDLITFSIGYTCGVERVLDKNEFFHGPSATLIRIQFPIDE